MKISKKIIYFVIFIIFWILWLSLVSANNYSMLTDKARSLIKSEGGYIYYEWYYSPKDSKVYRVKTDGSWDEFYQTQSAYYDYASNLGIQADKIIYKDSSYVYYYTYRSYWYMSIDRKAKVGWAVNERLWTIWWWLSSLYVLYSDATYTYYVYDTGIHTNSFE